MPTRCRLPIALLALSLLFAMGCTKELPGALKAVPADSDFVGTLDAKAMLAYTKQALPKLVPANLRDQIPTFEALTKQAMQMFGIDLDKLTKVHFFGLMAAEQAAVIVEGLSAQGLTGKQASEHKGVALYAIGDEIHYAELKGLGLVFAPNPEWLKKVIDTFSGDAKGLAGTERGKLIGELMKVHEDMDLMRLYVLTGQLPKVAMELPVKVQGGGMFLHVDRGAAVTVLADKAAVDKIAQAVGMGLMAMQAALMMGGGQDMPVQLDKETKDAISGMLGKIRTDKKDNQVTVSFQGDLKPIIEKVATLGAQAYQAEQAPPKHDLDELPAGDADADAPDAPAEPAEPAVR